MYGKVHNEIFDSSLMADGGWLPSYIFMCMISLSDGEGMLRHDPRTLYRKIGLQEDDRVSFGEFMDAVEFLEQPDELSNLPAHEGRRIIPVSQLDHVEGNRGWFIVNKVHYRDKGGSHESQRERWRDRKRRQRERENKDLDTHPPECHGTVTPCHVYTDTDTDTDKKKNGQKATLFGSFWTAYPKKRKKQEALKVWKSRSLDQRAEEIIADVEARKAKDERWNKGFIPDPTTYLRGSRWEDAFDEGDTDTRTPEQRAKDVEELARWLDG